MEMRKMLFVVLAAPLFAACAGSVDLTITENFRGSRVRIVNAMGREVVGNLEFGQSTSIDAKGVEISADNGSSTSEVRLTALGYRLSDGCKLGSATYFTTVNSGGDLTGVKTDSWQINGFDPGTSSVGPSGECLEGKLP